VATALALVHPARPDLKIDSTTVALFVIAVVPWMGDLFHGIELPGGARREHRRLEERIGAAEERATRLDQQVDGAAAAARAALAVADSPDPDEDGRDDGSWAVGRSTSSSPSTRSCAGRCRAARCAPHGRSGSSARC
jgi:hypothetical protein